MSPAKTFNVCCCDVCFAVIGLTWIMFCKFCSIVFGRTQPIQVVGCHWNCLIEPVFTAALLFRVTRLGHFEKITSHGSFTLSEIFF